MTRSTESRRREEKRKETVCRQRRCFDIGRHYSHDILSYEELPHGHQCPGVEVGDDSGGLRAKAFEVDT